MSKEEIAFRKINESEKEIIEKCILKHFGNQSLQAIFCNHLWVKEGRIKEVYVVIDQIDRLATEIVSNLYSLGLPIGSFESEEFQLEIEGALIISPFTDRKLIVKTDQFLYGKPIFVDNIVEYKQPFDIDDLIIIVGKNNLHYGIGRAIINSADIENSEPNTIIVKGYQNKPLDRGWYLRKGN